MSFWRHKEEPTLIVIIPSNLSSVAQNNCCDAATPRWNQRATVLC